MTWCPWERSQTTELAATASNAWYRRCLTRGCRIWAGPYTDIAEAKTDGMDHQHHAHNLPTAQAESRLERQP